MGNPSPNEAGIPPWSSMADNSGRILKILCIHGYRQNAQTFRERTGAFRKVIKKYAELVFISAPNVVPPMESEEGEEKESVPDQRGWWFSQENDYFRAQDESTCCKGFEESLKVIEESISEQGPFDGILGFSQGATMAALVCGLQQMFPDKPFKFGFAILVAGFKSRSSGHQQYMEQPITLPTLHVFGDTDKVIPKDLSEDLMGIFQDVVPLNHPGGHFIPASAPQKKVYQEFLSNMLTRKVTEPQS